MNDVLPRTVCAELGISRETLYRWCDTGILHPQKLGPLGWRVFDKAEIQSIKKKMRRNRKVGESLLSETCVVS